MVQEHLYFGIAKTLTVVAEETVGLCHRLLITSYQL